MKNNRGGFMVELLIVTAIIAILAAMAIPAFQKIKAHNEKQKSALYQSVKLPEQSTQQPIETNTFTLNGVTYYLIEDKYYEKTSIGSKSYMMVPVK